MKRLLMLMLALTLVLVLASCGGCDPHVDDDGDSVCDNCGEYITIKVNFTVKFENGQPFSATSLLLTRGGKTITVDFDESGKGSADIPAGLYYVSFEGAYMTDVPGIKVDATTTEISLTVIDNTPDGTESKPFFISSKENQITLAPGQEIFYSCHASSAKFVRVYSEYVTIGYDREIYTSENGCVEVALKVVDGGNSLFSLKNISHSELNTTLYLESPIGASDNPIQLTGNSIEATVTTDGVTYYSWVADKSGLLSIASPFEGVEISFTKIIEGDIPVKSETDESGVSYMNVALGDIIKIEVSVKSASVDNPVDLAISLNINN